MIVSRGLQKWLQSQAVLWLGVVALLATDVPRVSASGLGYTVCSIALGSYALLWVVLRPAGLVADYVTLTRFFTLVSALAWGCYQDRVTLWIWVLCGLALLADLLDGWAARRFGGSEQGAILDMEADQLVIALLASVAHLYLGVAWWVLVMPGLRPVYVLASALWGLPAHDPKPRDGDNRRGRFVAALVMGALWLAITPASWLELAWKHWIAAFALVALLWSFSSDFGFLLSRRRLSGSGGSHLGS